MKRAEAESDCGSARFQIWHPQIFWVRTISSQWSLSPFFLSGVCRWGTTSLSDCQAKQWQVLASTLSGSDRSMLWCGCMWSQNSGDIRLFASCFDVRQGTRVLTCSYFDSLCRFKAPGPQTRHDSGLRCDTIAACKPSVCVSVERNRRKECIGYIYIVGLSVCHFSTYILKYTIPMMRFANDLVFREFWWHVLTLPSGLTWDLRPWRKIFVACKLRPFQHEGLGRTW